MAPSIWRVGSFHVLWKLCVQLPTRSTQRNVLQYPKLSYDTKTINFLHVTSFSSFPSDSNHNLGHFSSYISQGSPENQNQLACVIMEAQKIHDRFSANWRTRKASGVVWSMSKGLRTRMRWLMLVLESEDLRTRRSDVKGQEKMDIPAKEEGKFFLSPPFSSIWALNRLGTLMGVIILTLWGKN